MQIDGPDNEAAHCVESFCLMIGQSYVVNTRPWKCDREDQRMADRAPDLSTFVPL